MLQLITLFSLNFVPAVNRYIFFFIFLSCSYFFSYSCEQFFAFCFWYPVYFFSILSSIYFLPPCSTLIFKQVFTLKHVTSPAFHCLSSKFILLQISLKNPSSFLSPFIILDFFLSQAECFCSNDVKHKHLYV